MLDQLGRRLRQERVRLGLDQTDFGAMVAISKNSQSAYEGGKTSPTAEYLLKLAVHGVDIGYVLTGLRSDGSVGMIEKQILEMFGQLDESEKGVIFNLLCLLTGNMLDAGSTKQSFVASLHEKAREYRGGDEKD